MTRQETNNYVTKTGTVSGTALTLTDLGLTADEIEAANVLLISISDDDARWRKDGTAPTATVGHFLAKATTPLTIAGNPDIKRFQFIRTGGDAKYVVELEK